MDKIETTNGEVIHSNPVQTEQPETVLAVETEEEETDVTEEATPDWEKQSAGLLKRACKTLKKLEANKLRGYLLAGRDLQGSLNLSMVNGISRKVASQVLYGSISKATGRETSESFVSLLLSCWAIVCNLAGQDYLEALEAGKQPSGASWDGLKRISSCLKRDDSKEVGDLWDISEKVAAVENGASKLKALVRTYLAGGMSAAKIEEEYKSIIKPPQAATASATQTGAGRNPNPAGTPATAAQTGTDASAGITLAPPTGSASTVPSVQDASGKASAGSPPKPLISTTPAADAESILSLVKGTADPATTAERIGNILARGKEAHQWKLLQGWIDCADDDALGKLHVMVQAEAKERAAIKSRKAVVDAQTRNSIALGRDATEAHAEEQPAKIVA